MIIHLDEVHGKGKLLTIQHPVVVRIRKLPHFAKHLARRKILFKRELFMGKVQLLSPCLADVTSSSPPLQLGLKFNSLHFFL